MTWGIFKSDSVSEAYKKMKSSCSSESAKEEKKEVEEELKGNQHKLDKNKNGKLDSQDFKMLRKEEAEQLDEMEFDKDGRYVHKAKPGVYGGSEKESDYVKGPSDAALKKIEAEKKKKKMKKEDFEIFNDKELDILINEVLSKDQPAGKWISDFVHSEDPKFAGKSKEKRKQMALAAYYSAQKNESVEYDSFLSEEGNPAPFVGRDAKEIKHANMKDKQDDQEVMEPHSGTEQQFVDAHSVSVTDEPNKDGTPNGADKAKRADEPKGKGPGSYDAKEKLGDQKTGVKEAVFKTAAGEEIDTEPQTKETNGKKKLGEVKKKVAAADSASNY